MEINESERLRKIVKVLASDEVTDGGAARLALPLELLRVRKWRSDEDIRGEFGKWLREQGIGFGGVTLSGLVRLLRDRFNAQVETIGEVLGVTTDFLGKLSRAGSDFSLDAFHEVLKDYINMGRAIGLGTRELMAPLAATFMPAASEMSMTPPIDGSSSWGFEEDREYEQQIEMTLKTLAGIETKIESALAVKK